MDFLMPGAQIFIPDGLPPETALARTTHIGIAAHQDDLELMAVNGILTCFQQKEHWFTGVVLTNGRGSPRAGPYAGYSDDEMQAVRTVEQKKAAIVGEYAAQVLFDFPSAAVKDMGNPDPVNDLVKILRAARPEVVYMHNLADKHETHIGAALKTLAALRSLPVEERPQRCYGVEIWRGLDWLPDEDKVVFDLSAHENLQAALLGVFDSQIAGGKRYDLAAPGRRRANATYFAPRGVDAAAGLSYAMDVTPLVQDETLDIAGYVQGYLDRFAAEVLNRLR
ncbi:MAG: PIG-L family deacetylase [Anaerolineaceae bacterium]|nr:PIG-L family deacetylase [Anaerolineaceae bacterium]